MIGHSTGGGEVARYIGRHGTKRVAKAVLIGAVPPLMLKTAANPGGLPIEVFDGFRTAYLADRSQFFLDVASGPFFGFNRPGAKVSQGLIDSWWLQGMMSGHKNAYDCIKAFSETDFTEDLKKFDVPTLIIHGDDDQIVPIGASALLSAKLVKNATLKIYPGGTHGLGDTSKEQLNADLLAFARPRLGVRLRCDARLLARVLSSLHSGHGGDADAAACGRAVPVAPGGPEGAANHRRLLPSLPRGGDAAGAAPARDLARASGCAGRCVVARSRARRDVPADTANAWQGAHGP